ncbi:hypothetical protein D5013_002892, partial [Listeria monocytogenes]
EIIFASYLIYYSPILMDLSHLYASSLCISFPLIIAPVAHLFCEHSVKQFNEKQLKIGFLCKKFNN